MVATDLGDLGGDGGTTATDLNDRGQVVSYTLTGEPPFQQSTGFLWWCGVMLELPLSVTATGVNARGQVIGDGRLWTPARDR